MALIATPTTVDTTVKRLDIAETVTRFGLTIANRGATSVFLGPPGVTPATGFELAPGERLSLTLRPSDGGIYAVSASGQNRIDRLQVGWS